MYPNALSVVRHGVGDSTARIRDTATANLPSEGTPLIISPGAVFKIAHSPNAARLFQSFLFSIEAQQSLVVDASTSAP